ncbi:hypothetical protein [Pantoea ananatis]|uniref:hypothetical protein n=1 Tax=Pantoea ananas TaxID=553 RepID=UPI00069866FD|nr:hypothetical protein [Pantoea ananatis]PQK80231.1 hypothetical protein CG428_02410 [Pantoea ananatis]
MKKLLVAALSIFILSGCKPTDDQLVKVGKEGLLQNLKDPESAQFKDMFFHPDEKQKNSVASGYVCGELNAKNSLGGYVGFYNVAIRVVAEPRWYFPVLGITYSVSDPFRVDDGDGLQTRNDKLYMYLTKCGKAK